MSGVDSNEKSKLDDSMRMITIPGIFLLILAVSGNFVAETMSCQTQKLLSENMYAKHIVIITMIYFSLGLVSGENRQSPVGILKQAVYIWTFFIMFNKMNISFTLVVLAMLAMLLLCNNYIAYYKHDDSEKNKEVIETLTTFMDYTTNISILTTILGFGLYFKKQHADYIHDFSYTKFLFGTTKCSKL